MDVSELLTLPEPEDSPCLTDEAGSLCAALIPLTRSRFAVIDERDDAAVGQHRWCFHHHGYAVRSVPVSEPNRRQKQVSMHRTILAPSTDGETDHRNGIGTDNRRRNLRLCTVAQNQQNRRSHAPTSGYRGVSWNKVEKKWKACIRVNGLKHHLGYFRTAESGARAYDEAARKHFGEFARLNFPLAHEAATRE